MKGFMKRAGLLGAVVAAVMGFTAWAAIFTGGVVTAPSYIASVSNATVYTNSSSVIPIVQNVDLELQVTLTTTNAGTSNTILGFNATMDNANWSVIPWLTVTNPAAGTTSVVYQVIVPHASLHGIQGLRWDTTSTTQTNTVGVGLRWGQFY